MFFIDMFVLIVVSFILVFYVFLLGCYSNVTSSGSFFFYLMWLGFFMIFSIDCSSYHLFCLLFINSFISMYVVLKSYGFSSGLLIVLSFKLISEFCLYFFYGFYLSVNCGFYLEVFVSYMSYDFKLKCLFMFFIFVYSLIGVLGFWIYWVMETSYFVSIYLHSCGFVMVGCVIFSSMFFLFFINDYYFLINCLGCISFICFFVFMLFFMLVSDVKKSFGFFSASSVSYLFLLSVLNSDWFVCYFLVSSVIKILVFEFLYLVNSSFSFGVLFVMFFILFFIFLFLVGLVCIFSEFFNVDWIFSDKFFFISFYSFLFSLLLYIYVLKFVCFCLFLVSIIFLCVKFSLFFFVNYFYLSSVFIFVMFFYCFFILFIVGYIFGSSFYLFIGLFIFFLEFIILEFNVKFLFYVVIVEFIWKSFFYYYYSFVFKFVNFGLSFFYNFFFSLDFVLFYFYSFFNFKFSSLFSLRYLLFFIFVIIVFGFMFLL